MGKAMSTEKGKVIKSRGTDGEDFWYVIFPGERAEEFETEAEATAYLADMRRITK